MTTRPPYFNRVRENAARRWEQLERDPELAGPWHQLFAQVQSPRHVLSELLQNADDAGATEAVVMIVNQAFVFAHDGEDFAEEHFASLCRFGYSNKRALHTIGFRGIGFKSTFSLGDTVELFTPSLALAFHRRRFTEPSWIEDEAPEVGVTKIRVAIKDTQRQLELEKNLQEWVKSPFSLVFFKNIRRIQIGREVIEWTHLRPGPVPGTEWMALNGNAQDAYLIARSEPEPFPPEALNEIRHERLLGTEQELDFPPCRVEIVLGAKGRLYVVLPTGVETELPFACNAPFIQDPARFKIKPPETSPTNRWLLERVGRLVGSVMLRWLEAENLSDEDRARAYTLLSDLDRDDPSLEGSCGAIVECALHEEIDGKRLLLTDSGSVVEALDSVAVPSELLYVWSHEQVSEFFDQERRPVLSRHVSSFDLRRLTNWGLVTSIGSETVLHVLQKRRLPRPATWGALVQLWAYAASKTQTYQLRALQPQLRIIPVQGKADLYAATETARLGERKLLQSESDWEFLSAHLLALDSAWLRFLSEHAGGSETSIGESESPVQSAAALLNRIGLGETSEIGKIVEQVAAAFFTTSPVSLPGCIRLAQISAKLNISVGKSFRFVTQNRHLRRLEDVVVFDRDRSVAMLLPDEWCEKHLLHHDYTKAFSSCTADEWNRWFASGRSGLAGFTPLINKESTLSQRSAVTAEIEKRGGTLKPQFHFVTHQFLVDDWDFDRDIWIHWRTLAHEQLNLWGRIAELVLRQPDGFWSKAINARISHVSTSGSTRYVTSEPLIPSWILKLREYACLPDTRGFYHKPADLLRRTPETEPFIDIEPFVDIRFDQESTRPLLKLLGVRDTPTGPTHLLDRLRALAKAPTPPVSEVEKWYRRLDQMLEHCSTNDFATVREAFQAERLVLAEDMAWTSVPAVFLSSDEEDVPGAATVRAGVRDLALWRKIGVADRPTAELAIQWLRSLRSGEVLSPDDLRRVRSLLARHATKVWHECGHWINLANEWVPVAELTYCIAMRSLIPWKHLHDWVKRKTADLTRLPIDVLDMPPFASIAPLASHVEDRFHRKPALERPPMTCDWLNTLGRELTRVRLDDDAETLRTRELARALGDTRWQVSPGLEIIPYIHGTPAGLPRRAEVVWLDGVLHVDDLTTARLACLVPDTVGKVFGNPQIAAALAYCYGRSPAEVAEYAAENFDLAPAEVNGPAPIDPLDSETDAAADDWIEDLTDADDHTAADDSPTPSDAPSNATTSDEQVAPHESDSSVSEPTEAADETESAPESAPKPAHPKPGPKPPKGEIIERFALAQGFRHDGLHRFSHPDGSTLAKESGALFPWQRRTPSGKLIRYYWPKDHCLDNEPLQIDAAVWGLIESHPDTHALILANGQGEPVEVSGSKFKQMQERGRLGLYPATYRIALKHDEPALS